MVSVAVNPGRLLALSVMSLTYIVLVDELTLNDDFSPQYLPISASIDNCPSRTYRNTATTWLGLTTCLASK